MTRTNKPKPTQSYSEVAKRGLEPTFTTEDTLLFETIWLRARRPPTPRQKETFPRRIEGLTPALWFKSYLTESEKFHGSEDPCLLCSRVRRLMDELTRCPCAPISPSCLQCKEKSKFISYFDRNLLSNLHTQNADLLNRGWVGGEIRNIRNRPKAKAWSDPQNENKKGENLETHIKRELLKFSQKQSSDMPSVKVPETTVSTKETQKNQDSMKTSDVTLTKPVTHAGVAAMKQDNPERVNQDNPEEVPAEAPEVHEITRTPDDPVAPLPTSNDEQITRTSDGLAVLLPTDDDEQSWLEDAPWIHDFYVCGPYP